MLIQALFSSGVSWLGHVSKPASQLIQASYLTRQRFSSPPMQPFAKVRRRIPKVDYVLMVASGKGGVGKSSTAGPSIPQLMNLTGISPEVTNTQPSQIIPLQNHGLSCMSMGSLVDYGKALAWRGPMVGKALEQLLFGVVWGRLDVLVVDTPPGTGDTHINLAQRTHVAGSLIVSTPQEVALSDVRRSIEMLRHMKIPVLGVIENMSHHVCANCGHKSHIFGTRGATDLAAELNLPLLGNIPLDGSNMQAGEAGLPVVLSCPDGAAAHQFNAIATCVWDSLRSQPTG